VSTRDQNPAAQRDALTAAGCEEVFIDKASGKLARRSELDRALLVARGGDQLVVTKLDRLGRSLEHLIDLSKDLQATLRQWVPTLRQWVPRRYRDQHDQSPGHQADQ
jgi:DNA invertase Pin-like site-specific DNA recombinase